MFGKSNEQIRMERANVVKQLEDKGYKVVDSIIAETPEQALNEPVFYLSQSILLLSKCNYAYFMQGWEEARGCRIEHTIAKEYGILY